MSLCEIWYDVECLGVDECVNSGECKYLECDGDECEYYDNEYGCNRPNSCKKER